MHVASFCICWCVLWLLILITRGSPALLTLTSILFQFGLLLWVLTYVGSWFNGMTLIILSKFFSFYIHIFLHFFCLLAQVMPLRRMFRFTFIKSRMIFFMPLFGIFKQEPLFWCMFLYVYRVCVSVHLQQVIWQKVVVQSVHSLEHQSTWLKAVIMFWQDKIYRLNSSLEIFLFSLSFLWRLQNWS